MHDSFVEQGFKMEFKNSSIEVCYAVGYFVQFLSCEEMGMGDPRKYCSLSAGLLSEEQTESGRQGSGRKKLLN